MFNNELLKLLKKYPDKSWLLNNLYKNVNMPVKTISKIISMIDKSSDEIDEKDLYLKKIFNREIVNFRMISSNPNLDIEFISKYEDKLSWDLLTDVMYFDFDIIKRFSHKIDWNILSVKDKSICSPNEWIYIIETFMIPNNVNWIDISRCFPLDIKFIEKYKDQLIWDILECYEDLVCNYLDFIETHIDKLYLIQLYRWLSFNPKHIEFLLRHQDELDWDTLSENKDLTSNLINSNMRSQFKILSENELYWYHLSNDFELTIDFIEEHKNKIDWTIMSESRNLSLNFIEQYEDYIDWSEISRYTKLPNNFIIKHANKLNWSNISKYQKLDVDIAKKYKHKIKWKHLSKNYHIKVDEPKWMDFIDENRREFDWYYLSLNDTIDITFIERFYQNIFFHELPLGIDLNIDSIKKYYNELSYIFISSYTLINQEIIDINPQKIVWHLLSSNKFNFSPNTLKRNKKIYSDLIKQELVLEIEKREIKLYKVMFNSVIDMLKLRIRDLHSGLRQSMIHI